MPRTPIIDIYLSTTRGAGGVRMPCYRLRLLGGNGENLQEPYTAPTDRQRRANAVRAAKALPGILARARVLMPDGSEA